MTEPLSKEEKRKRFILSAADIEQMPGVQKVHFLNPNGRRTNRSLGDATGIQGFGFHHITVPAGADSTEYHRHHQEDECVYVLSGKALLTLDDDTYEVGPGDFIAHVAGGPAHMLHNPGPEPLVCLVVGQRLPHDVGDYPRKGQRIYRNGAQWDLVRVEDIRDPKKTNPTVGGK